MRIALLTPSYAPDLMRFRLLRESLLAAGCRWPHVAVVQTEDLPAFRAAGLDAGVELVASADVLPAEVERRRQQVRARPLPVSKLRRSLNKRFGWFADASCDGWHAQQIVKLAVAASTAYDVVVTFDSDIVVTGRVLPEAFVRAGAVALMGSVHRRPTHPHWRLAAAALLGLPAPPADAPDWFYVAHPFAFSTAVARELHRALEARHGKPWWQVLADLRVGQLSEFTLYGLFARDVMQMRGLFEASDSAHTRWLYTAEDRARTDAVIAESFADPSIDYLVLQASRRWPVEPHLPAVRAQLAARDRRAAAR